jgi:hypothetical protein
MNKILPKDRIRSEKVAGRQAKRWRNAGHERAPAIGQAVERSGPSPAVPRKRRGIRAPAETPP